MATDSNGRTDPARSLAVLWRTHERASRKGRPDLSVDRIARVALDIADTEGIAALSMRRVAEQLGVGTMSLYTHVPGKGELLDVMLDTVYGETDRTEHTPDQWRTHLECVARENWAMHRRHPWTLHVPTQRAVLGPQAVAKYDYELRGLDGIGLTDVEMDSVLALVLGHVHGAARGEAENTHIEQDSGLTDHQWWETHAPLLERMLDPRRFPTAARVGTAAGAEHGTAFSATHHFEFGLHRILDGIEQLIGSRTPNQAVEGQGNGGQR